MSDVLCIAPITRTAINQIADQTRDFGFEVSSGLSGFGSIGVTWFRIADGSRHLPSRKRTRS